MKRALGILLLVVAWAVAANAQKAAEKSPLIAVHKPTIIAFFPTTQAEVDSNQDASEALSDFNYYVFNAQEPLKKVGIEVQIVNERSFRIQTGAKVRNFPNSKARAGYYFIQPGRQPHVEYGVMTDDGLLDTARRYFGMQIH
jgi:hypothetical protein